MAKYLEILRPAMTLTPIITKASGQVVNGPPAAAPMEIRRKTSDGVMYSAGEQTPRPQNHFQVRERLIGWSKTLLVIRTPIAGSTWQRC